ncbi:MAG: hypothetical protein MUD08_01335 [Cytophagales bacterium]|jgi:cytoskeletal protein CcmA (bactofilin family)|nr:hypothetical protein [Cytophagales bacterium]
MKYGTWGEIISFKKIEYSEKFDLMELTDGDSANEDIFGDDPESVFYHKGDVVLEGNTFVKGSGSYGMYVIDGNLTVNGSLAVRVSELYNVLYVTGNLTVRNLFVTSDAYLIVKGQCKVGNLLYNDLSEGGGFFLHGKLEYSSLVTGSRASFYSLEKGYVNTSTHLLKREYEDMAFEEVVRAVLNGEDILK